MHAVAFYSPISLSSVIVQIITLDKQMILLGSNHLPVFLIIRTFSNINQVMAIKLKCQLVIGFIKFSFGHYVQRSSGDMKFIFQCQEQYLKNEAAEQMRYCC